MEWLQYLFLTATLRDTANQRKGRIPNKTPTHNTKTVSQQNDNRKKKKNKKQKH